jgi:hypothetical protein
MFLRDYMEGVKTNSRNYGNSVDNYIGLFVYVFYVCGGVAGSSLRWQDICDLYNLLFSKHTEFLFPLKRFLK